MHLSFTNALSNRPALPEFLELHLESWKQEPVQFWLLQEKDGGEWIRGKGLGALSSYLTWQAKNKPYIVIVGYCLVSWALFKIQTELAAEFRVDKHAAAHIMAQSKPGEPYQQIIEKSDKTRSEGEKFYQKLARAGRWNEIYAVLGLGSFFLLPVLGISLSE
jgi:hypothetical protein